ncbi:MAG: glycosyltransferase 61 family protein [Chitinophagaceae bacterium]|nr:glycosyltransferase 61 family protein [Chitinophagaceae bacterium]
MTRSHMVTAPTPFSPAGSTVPIALAEVPDNHPCLWGRLELLPAAPLLEEPDAKLLPTRRTGQAQHWWTSRKQGAIDRQGQPITAINDVRGARPIYALPDDLSDIRLGKTRRRPVVLYGGTVFEHFGHLLLDLNRLYRLLLLFRRSREPIWVHYPALGDGGTIENPLVKAWFDCLGIRKRVRVVRCSLGCDQLVSSPALYRDRCYATADFPRAAQHALAPKLRRRLLALEPDTAPIAYLSRHQLSTGTTRFDGELEVVEALRKLPNVTVICPEELSIEAKLGLYRRHRVITGFVQAAMVLKYFVPTTRPGDLARQLMLVAGRNSLNSNWVNMERAFGFGDQLLDCTHPSGAREGEELVELGSPQRAEGFQRLNRFNAGLVIDQLRALSER